MLLYYSPFTACKPSDNLFLSVSDQREAFTTWQRWEILCESNVECEITEQLLLLSTELLDLQPAAFHLTNYNCALGLLSSKGL